MTNPEQIEFGENGAIQSADPLRAADLKELPDAALLEWRQPYWLFGFLAWVFAGPLNPAAFPVAFLMNGQAYAAVFFVAVPSALGVGIFVILKLGKPMSLGQLAGGLLCYALATIPIYTALFVMFMFGENGLRDGGILEMLVRGAQGFFTGIFAGIAFGWVWLVFALPAAVGAIIAVRVVSLRLVPDPADS